MAKELGTGTLSRLSPRHRGLLHKQGTLFRILHRPLTDQTQDYPLNVKMKRTQTHGLQGSPHLQPRMKASRAGCRTGWCTGSKPSQAGDQLGHNTSRDTILTWTGALLDGILPWTGWGWHYAAILLLNQRAELTLKNDQFELVNKIKLCLENLRTF